MVAPSYVCCLGPTLSMIMPMPTPRRFRSRSLTRVILSLLTKAFMSTIGSVFVAPTTFCSSRSRCASAASLSGEYSASRLRCFCNSPPGEWHRIRFLQVKFRKQILQPLTRRKRRPLRNWLSLKNDPLCQVRTCRLDLASLQHRFKLIVMHVAHKTLFNKDPLQ